MNAIGKGSTNVKKPVEYKVKVKVNDMVMACVQVNSSAADGAVGKLAIEARGPF